MCTSDRQADGQIDTAPLHSYRKPFQRLQTKNTIRYNVVVLAERQDYYIGLSNAVCVWRRFRRMWKVKLGIGILS